MLTLYGFGRVNSKVVGLTRDWRALWTLEELGVPYRVTAWIIPQGKPGAKDGVQRRCPETVSKDSQSFRPSFRPQAQPQSPRPQSPRDGVKGLEIRPYPFF